MPKASRSQDVLQQLIQERHRYEEWLAALELRRAATPERVYDRVRQDYEGRLANVRDQLGSRSEELRAAIGRLEARISDAGRQEADRVDALHEVELRAAVGEYTPTQWEAMKAEAELDLKKLADDKKRTGAELELLQQILDQTGSSAAGAAAVAGPAVSEARSAAGEPEAEPAPPPPPPPPPAKKADAPAPKRATPARSRPAARDEAMPDIRTLAPAAAAKAGDSEKAPEARPEHEKTLKCQECGVFNYPTEWYCENCGGELATL